ncbi:MAG: D-glycero-beta-D-manno-heptose 1,7-bisphosphate 7-phosphatase [Marinilabiliales bacterium]
MKKAVFLDRDGVINREIGQYVYKIEDFYFNKGIFENLKLLQDNDFLLIIISNQGGVSKGLYTKYEVEILHGFLISEFLKNNVNIADIFYCPHHDEVENCLCRKPKDLLIRKALAIYDIDPQQSAFIGDSERDIKSAKNAGIAKQYLIKSNQNINEFCNEIINTL